MKTKTYIIKKIDELVAAFPNIKASYSIDDFDHTNYVKILPPSEYHHNEEYKAFETNVIIDFIKKFPCSGIGFLSEEDLIELSTPLYEAEGDLFTKSHVDAKHSALDAEEPHLTILTVSTASGNKN